MQPAEQIFNALCAAHAYADNPQQPSTLRAQLNMEPAIFAEALEHLISRKAVRQFIGDDAPIWIPPTRTALC